MKMEALRETGWPLNSSCLSPRRYGFTPSAIAERFESREMSEGKFTSWYGRRGTWKAGASGFSCGLSRSRAASLPPLEMKASTERGLASPSLSRPSGVELVEELGWVAEYFRE